MMNVNTPDARRRRYYRWFDETLEEYPADVVGEEHWRVAVRYCSVLDCAAVLLPDAQLDRLMALLAHLDTDAKGGFFPGDATSRLAGLPGPAFASLISRQLAVVLADPTASVTDRAVWWRLGLTFDVPRGQVATMGGDPVPPIKPFRDLLIDHDLTYSHMERLNAIDGITIRSTCAGHPEQSSGPHVVWTTSDGRRGEVEASFVNTGKNSAELTSWWDHVVEQLERDPESLPSTGS